MSADGKPGGFNVRLVELLHGASIEVAAHPEVAAKLRGAFDPGTEVFINQPPSGDYRACVATAAALHRAGFVPVPHVAARNLASAAELDDFLQRLVGEGAIDRLLLIGGDARPGGPFSSVVDVIASGRIQAAGVGTVGVAGHPEGNAFADIASLDRAIVEKTGSVAAAGLRCFIVTQFCFEAAPILDYLERLARLRVDAPVRIGVAGPASIATLIRFAERCGVGESLRALRERPKTVGSSIGEAGPEDLLRDVADGLTDATAPRVRGIHFYAFGGIARTSTWIEATLARLYGAIAASAEAESNRRPG
jgi:methylenetetrahydrofolate reductase (NADPH)